MKVLSTTIGLFLSVNANGVFGSDSSNIHGSAGLNTEQETQQFSVKFMKAMKNMKLEDVAISEKVGAGGGMTSKSQNHEKGVSKSLDNEGLGDMMKAGKNNGGLEKPLDDAFVPNYKVEKADDQNNSPGVTKEVFTGRVEQKGLASTSSFTLDEGMSRLKRLNGGGLRGSNDVDSAAVITEVKDILELHLDSLQSIQGSCNEPIAIGEIRNWADKSQCIDPSGKDGNRGVGTWLCDGLMDQTFKFCEDGTIRSSKSGFCLDVDGNDGSGNVQMWSCVVFPTVAQDQQWDLVPIGGTYVESGIHQKLFYLKNRKSRKCLDIQGYDSVGNVLVYDCDGYFDQKLYIRSRGDVIGHGKLQNEKSKHCLDVNGNNGHGNIGTWTCMDELQQVFTLYENGELVNAVSKQCMDIGGHDGHGNVEMYSCVALPDQQWKQKRWRGEYFSFVSKKSGMCLDVSGYDGKGDASTWECDDLPDQKWRFIASPITSPTYTPTTSPNPVGTPTESPIVTTLLPTQIVE